MTSYLKHNINSPFELRVNNSNMNTSQELYHEEDSQDEQSREIKKITTGNSDIEEVIFNPIQLEKVSNIKINNKINYHTTILFDSFLKEKTQRLQQSLSSSFLNKFRLKENNKEKTVFSKISEQFFNLSKHSIKKNSAYSILTDDIYIKQKYSQSIEKSVNNIFLIRQNIHQANKQRDQFHKNLRLKTDENEKDKLNKDNKSLIKHRQLGIKNSTIFRNFLHKAEDFNNQKKEKLNKRKADNNNLIVNSLQQKPVLNNKTLEIIKNKPKNHTLYEIKHKYEPISRSLTIHNFKNILRSPNKSIKISNEQIVNVPSCYYKDNIKLLNSRDDSSILNKKIMSKEKEISLVNNLLIKGETIKHKKQMLSEEYFKSIHCKKLTSKHSDLLLCELFLNETIDLLFKFFPFLQKYRENVFSEEYHKQIYEEIKENLTNDESNAVNVHNSVLNLSISKSDLEFILMKLNLIPENSNNKEVIAYIDEIYKILIKNVNFITLNSLVLFISALEGFYSGRGQKENYLTMILSNFSYSTFDLSFDEVEYIKRRFSYLRHHKTIQNMNYKTIQNKVSLEQKYFTDFSRNSKMSFNNISSIKDSIVKSKLHIPLENQKTRKIKDEIIKEKEVELQKVINECTFQPNINLKKRNNNEFNSKSTINILNVNINNVVNRLYSTKIRDIRNIKSVEDKERNKSTKPKNQYETEKVFSNKILATSKRKKDKLIINQTTSSMFFSLEPKIVKYLLSDLIKSKSEKPIFTIDIRIDDSKNDKLSFYKHENPMETVNRFCRVYGLNSNKKEMIIQIVNERVLPLLKK